MTDDKLFGLVLAGGRSSRMGSDKSLISYHGIPQREYLFKLLSKFCGEVFVSCKQDQSIPQELNPIPDKLEIESPLNGIISAFRTHAHVAWITVPIDMPNIDSALIENLIGARAKDKLATCYTDSTRKRPEPLLTLWEKSSMQHLELFINQGGVSPREFLESHDHRMIEVSEKSALTNINTQQELKNFQVMQQNLRDK